MIEDAQRIGKKGNGAPASADSAREGVSVVICCHDSAKLLTPVLEHLKAQQQVADLLWEVVVVDNASTDNTTAVARRCWNGFEKAPLRVVSEPCLGLSNARNRGLSEATYEFVTFVDDDNWVDRHWVAVVNEVMSDDPRVGAVGSYNEPIADVPFPGWFANYHGMYAVFAERNISLYSRSTNRLCGAGMTVRKSAWEGLTKDGFHHWLIDRKGTALSCGGDTELSYALYLNGWRLLLEPRLRLQHYIPEHRLNWRYFRRMVRSYAVSHTALDAYHLLQHTGRSDGLGALRNQWWWHLKMPLSALARHPIKAFKAVFRPLEADPGVVELEAAFGRLLGLLKLRGRYRIARREIQRARWRKLESLL